MKGFCYLAEPGQGSSSPASLHNNFASQHVHSAGEFEFAGFRWRELDDHWLIKRQLPFDVEFSQHNLSPAGRFDLAHEGNTRRDTPPQFEALRLITLLAQSDGYRLRSFLGVLYGLRRLGPALVSLRLLNGRLSGGLR